MQILLTPPVAFLIYLFVAGMLVLFGKLLAGRSKSASALKSSTYSSGETPPTRLAAPGYRPFFVVALFFAVLHLGVLMIGSSDLSPVAGVYLLGLILALIALILG